MPLRLPLATLPLLAALLLAACARPADPPAEPGAEADVEFEAPDERPADLLGTWRLAEHAGASPDVTYTLTFGADGAYVLRDEDGTEQRRTWRAVGPGRIEVSGAETPTGEAAPAERYAYEVAGQTLTLTITGTEAVTTFERVGDAPDPGTPEPVLPGS